MNKPRIEEDKQTRDFDNGKNCRRENQISLPKIMQ